MFALFPIAVLADILTSTFELFGICRFYCIKYYVRPTIVIPQILAHRNNVVLYMPYSHNNCVA